MFKDIIWRFLILETFVMLGLCIHCGVNEHPQKQFCTSEFVLKAKLHRGMNFRGEYRMNILTVFQGDLEELNITDNRYVNLKISNTLDEGTYIIFGRNENGGIYSDKCKKNIPWFSTDRFYRKALTTYYKTGCDCIYEIGNYSSGKVCKWFLSYMKKFDRHCMWVNTGYFSRCQKAMITPWD